MTVKLITNKYTWDVDEYAEEDMEYEEETMTVVAIGITDASLF